MVLQMERGVHVVLLLRMFAVAGYGVISSALPMVQGTGWRMGCGKNHNTFPPAPAKFASLTANIPTIL